MSSNVVTIKLENLDEFHELVRKLYVAVGPAAVEPTLKSAADIMTKQVRSNVQSMFPASNSRKGKTENFLRFSPATRMGKLSGYNLPRVAVSFIRYRTKKAAPHAHLVEYGARGGQMPAKPFWRPAFDSVRQRMLALIEAHVIANIKKAAR